MLNQFEGEKQMAKQELKKCLGQVLYLKNLAKVEMRISRVEGMF